MTHSPPDVQNVPDVFRLLEQALRWVGTSYGSPQEFARLNPLKQQIIDALAQRERFVLVSKEPTPDPRDREIERLRSELVQMEKDHREDMRDAAAQARHAERYPDEPPGIY